MIMNSSVISLGLEMFGVNDVVAVVSLADNIHRTISRPILPRLVAVGDTILAVYQLNSFGLARGMLSLICSFLHHAAVKPITSTK